MDLAMLYFNTTYIQNVESINLQKAEIDSSLKDNLPQQAWIYTDQLTSKLVW